MFELWLHVNKIGNKLLSDLPNIESIATAGDGVLLRFIVPDGQDEQQTIVQAIADAEKTGASVIGVYENV